MLLVEQVAMAGVGKAFSLGATFARFLEDRLHAFG
jgi:hypothetical protein